MVTQGGTYGSTTGFRYSGGAADLATQGAQYGGAHAEEIQRIQTRGLAYGGPVAGGQYAEPAHIHTGSVYGTASPSIDTLIDVDSFALVLERGDGERRSFAVDAPKQSIQELSIGVEVNTMSDWRVNVPPDGDLYDWSFSRAIIGFKGKRIFHGVMLPVESGFGDTMKLGGFDPLWWATHGDLEVTYPDDHPDYTTSQDIPAWEALNDIWRRVRQLTDGRVRGIALQPEPENERIIPSSGETFEGTPLALVKRVHGYAGMAFALDHSNPANIAVSFVPGEERRAGTWISTDYDIDIDPQDYVNRVVCKGADAPAGYEFDRFRGVAEASNEEIATITHGEIIEHTMDAPNLQSEMACEEQAESKLDELRGNYSLRGSVECSPTDLTPGYTYRVPEFDDAAPDVFSPVRLPLQSLEHSYSLDKAQTTLTFETEEGVVRAIRDLLNPDAAAYEVLRQDLIFGDGTPGSGEETGLNFDFDLALDQ